MPQQTNLNVAPYFDDFEASNDFHKVLFKPGYPVQARELTTLQSILQNQIEKFGQHFFKEGAKVIPGNTGYTQLYRCIQLNNTFQGVPVAAYVDQLVGAKITGKNSGVTAVVDKVLLSEDSDRGNLTLYVSYLNSSTTNNSTETFSDGEEISSNTTITSGLLGNNSISAGDSLAVTFATNAAATGSAFQIQDGIYFIRGNFVNVGTETLILDQYNNKPSYRVGLFVNEEIINADQDESLNDNSQGYNNFSAPGADRLKITTSLFKKPLDDFDDNSFVELATIDNGELRALKRNTEYNYLADELARRTYDESGDYYIKPFDISVLNSLNNKKGNRGVFKDGQFTYGGETASEDLALYKLSPGKAYVRGYEIETISPTFLDVEKPRTTKTVKDNALQYNTGPTLKLNTAYGNPTVGLGNTYVVSLRSQRQGSTQTQAVGDEIGLARVYDYRLESGSYDASNGDVNEWDLSLYDVQMVTNLTVNTAQTLTVPTYIKGQNSGATGFLKDAVSAGTGVTVYDTTGSFIPNEKLTFLGSRGNDYGSATIKSIDTKSISDVHSVYGSLDGTIGINTFNSNVIQSTKFAVGVATITPYAAAGVATVTSANPTLVGLSTVGNLIAYTGDSTDPVYGRITAVDGTNNNVTIENVLAVTGVNAALSSDLVADGSGNGPTVSDLRVLHTSLDSSSDNTLYTSLPKRPISNVDLTSATITIRKTFDVQILNNQITAATTPTASTNETFLPFDEERYSLVRENGNTEVLTSDRVVISTAGNTFQAYNLADNGSAAVAEKATLVATLEKAKPKAKVKVLNKVNSVIIDKSTSKASGTGSTTLNDGLTYGNYPYGTRVQDDIISLNTPDIIEIHGVYEASDADTGNTLSAPKVTLTAITSNSTTTAEYLIGEEITGQTSGAVAIVAEKVANSASQIAYIYKNEERFVEGETIKSAESKLNAQIVTLTTPSFNIGSGYQFNTGQEKTIYDVGTITRRSDADAPKKKLRVYFSNGYYEATDDGDITTANSYDNFDYGTQIRAIDGIRDTDIIDIRPRTSTVSSISEGDRSPLEFYGRSFDASGNSAANILASDESILTTFSYYQGRIDRIFLTKNGKFQVKYGQPADRPDQPIHVEEAIEIATVSLPPYLFDPQDADLRFMEYKRYRMADIRKIDNRVKSLEYYTALSLLETNTANLFVPDGDGLNRFKSGFFVDNFGSFRPQEDRTPIKNSIDPKQKELRPRHYTNSVDLIFGPVVDVDESEDKNFATIEGTNVRKNNDIITLDYSEVEYIKQSFATRSESVTPFLISFWQGSMELTPASDTWVDTVRLDAKIINVEGNYATTMANMAQNEGIDPQTGLGPQIWGSWETTWTGTTVTDISTNRVEINDIGYQGWMGQPGGGVRYVYGELTDQVWEETVAQVTETGIEARSGTQMSVTEVFDNESVGDRVVSRDLVAYMRARNISFDAKRMKPLTRMYGFFDGEDVSKYCVPKLLEVTMDSGTFQVGETIIGQVIQTGLGVQNTDTTPSITFRVAQQNHKEGPYNTPTTVYTEDPYNNQVLGATYSSTSSIVNVDTYSLSAEAQGEWVGWVQTGMTLTGKSSGAQATIQDVRLISDLAADIQGSLYLPNPNSLNHPRFETGTKVFTLVNDENNDQDNASTIGEETFTASGTLETVQENIVSVRNARVEQKQLFQENNVNRNLGTQTIESTLISETTREGIIGWYDPLAQSFLVEDVTGVFLTSCDVFFRSKDDGDVPCVFQIRSMKNGFPTQHILPFSEIVLSPDDITISADGSVATSVEFKAPVYCEPGQEYAIALASNSTKYSVYVSRIGENDLLSQTYISNQPYLGSLFKSQNASTWEASQWEDLKFTLYRADFLENGTVETYNPELTKGNNQIAKLQPNPLSLTSRKQRLALDQGVSDGDIRFGNTITQTESLASANYVGSAGTATGDLGILNPGIGYTPSSGQVTYSGVNLVTITGNGHGATGDITVGNGVIVASGATIASGSAGGSGYMIGDVVGIDTLGSSPFKNIGSNARLTIAGIGSTSELIVDGVQGTFQTGAGYTMTFANNAGITTELNWTSGGGGVQLDTVDTESDGLHITVNHKNHGMYFADNKVIISQAQSDIKPTKLTTAYDVGSTGTLSVQDASEFSTFEQVGVGTTNVGFVQIGEEVLEYTNVSGNTIGGEITRGSNPASYPVGTPVYKYELGGVNLKRINKTHTLSDVTKSDTIGFDEYAVKLDMSEILSVGTETQNVSRAVDQGYAKLFINDTKSSGGYNVRATQNMPFEVITPMVQNLGVPGTTLEGEIRTVTSKSLSGSEIPWVDVGYETIALNQTNYLDTARMIASKVNADTNLTTLPGNKSFSMRLLLGTTDSRVTPVIDGQRISTILTSSRVNKVISNYATDERVNSLFTDPTACQYVSKEIQLETGASSLKILVAAHINKDCDIRAFYAINDKPGRKPIFIPFPGYSNLNTKGEVIAIQDNNGESDKYVTKTNTYGFNPTDLQYKDYTFTADPLPSFRSYRVKVILTSTNQVYVPRMKDLRVIALA